MANPLHKRLRRRIITPQHAEGGAGASGSKMRMVLTSAGILLVALLSVFAVMKYKRQSVITGNAPAPALAGVGRTETSTEGLQDTNAVVITSAMIVPPNPTSRTPLAVAYETKNPRGGLLTASFRWYVDNARVQDGPSNALQPGPYRKGASVYAEVILADQTPVSDAFITPAVVIANGPPEVTAVTLKPENAAVGAILSAIPSGADPDGDPIAYRYQWQVNGNPAGAPGSENTFSTAGLRKQDIISATVTYSDGTAEGPPVVSNTIRLENGAPKISSTSPTDLAGGLYVYQVAAKDPDGDPLTYRLDRFPSGMTINAASGLIRWELPKGVMFTGRNEAGVAVSVDDGDGGRDSQEFTITFTDLFVD